MKQVLDTSLLKEFDQPFGLSHGLPGAAYLSEEFARLENDSLFPGA